jgi:hypothetical protein
MLVVDIIIAIVNITALDSDSNVAVSVHRSKRGPYFKRIFSLFEHTF